MTSPRSFTLRALFDSACPPDWLDAHITTQATDLDPRLAPEALGAVARDPEEATRILAFLSDKRRRHWLAGRRAGSALAPMLGWGAAPAHIEPSLTGAPVLVQRHRRLPISITHSGDWAMAAASTSPALLGLDFEVGVKDKLYLKARVCSRQEIDHHGLEDPDLPLAVRCERLARIWVLKEALLKAYGVGLVADLQSFMATSLELDAPLRFEALRPLHKDIPHPLPERLWGAVTRFEGFPLAIVAAPGDELEKDR